MVPKQKKKNLPKKKKNPAFWIVANVLTLPISAYFAGIFAQLLAGRGSFSIVVEEESNAMTFAILDCITYFKQDLFRYLLGFLIAVLIINILAFYLKLRARQTGVEDDDRNFTYADSAAYGTSRWMNEEEKNRVLNTYSSPNQTDEIILGKDFITGKILTLPGNTKMNFHKCVIGGSGSGKSASVVRNDVLQNIKRGVSMVFTDPSGELFESLAPMLREKGYLVRVLNLVNIEHSDSWNCLSEIGGNDVNAQIFANAIIQNTGGDKLDDFWSKCAMNLLKALCLYVERSPVIPTNMGEVYKLLTSRKADGLDQLFDDLPMNDETQAAKMAYNVFRNASENVKGGVLIDLGSRLQIFQSSLVRKITEYNEIDFNDLGLRKSAFFVITSDQHSAFDFLAVLFYSMMFIKLVKLAQSSEGGKLPHRVNFLLDEFPNIGAIPDFTKKISTVRKYGLDITVIIQNIAQIQNRYPRGQWEEIIGNCDTMVFLGCTDNTTAEYISANTGVATIEVVSEAHSKNMTSMLTSIDYKESSGLGKRAILNPDEVKSMDRDDEIIFLHGEKPLRAKKYWYWTHPDAASMKTEKVDDYEPEWKKKEKENFAAKKDEEKSGTSQEQYEREKSEKAQAQPSLRDKVNNKNSGKPFGFR